MLQSIPQGEVMKHNRTKYIKCHVEFVLPVPPQVRDELDAVAEQGLSMLKEGLTERMRAIVPGTLHSSWQSMPQSWSPPRSNVVLEEQLTEDTAHVLVQDPGGEERVMFVDIAGPDDVTVTELEAGGEDDDLPDDGK